MQVLYHIFKGILNFFNALSCLKNKASRDFLRTHFVYNLSDTFHAVSNVKVCMKKLPQKRQNRPADASRFSVSFRY